MDEMKRRSKKHTKRPSSFIRDWGVLLATGIIAAAFSLWSERHWATAWLSYLPPLVWAVPVVLSWFWPLFFRRQVKGLNVLLQAIFLALILGFRIPWFSFFNRAEANLRVGSLNVERGRADPKTVAEWVRSEDLDVLCVQEANALRTDFWPKMRAELPEWTFILRREVGIITKKKVAASTAHPAPALNREIQVITLASTPPVTIVNNHWPALPMKLRPDTIEDFKYWMRERESFCSQLERVVRETSGPTIVAGDFNTPLNAGLFDRIQGLGSHAHRTSGWGYAWSYPSQLPLTAIDHLIARNCQPVEFRVGPIVGSDHRPVVAEIYVPR